jgi:hypothetical protein
LLSFILKPFVRRSRDNIEIPELDPDTELSVSLIESGCVFILINGQTALLIKSGEQEIRSFEKSGRISLEFELIERPEFPSLGAYVNIYDTQGNPTRFEYFFSLESGDETELLKKLIEQDCLDIVFYTTEIRHIKRTTINNEQKEDLASLLAQAAKVV